MTAAIPPGTIEIPTALDFEAALGRVTSAIEAAGLMIFARIDHAEGARQAGLAMPPTVVLLYGHAKGGTPIMLATPQAALDLPLRVLVRAADGGAVVSMHPAAPMLLQAGVPDALAHRLDPAQTLIVEALRPID